MPRSGKLPAVPDELITTPESLAAVCEHLRAAKRFAFDTEFIGENTYHPVLCLVQVATTERVELIDPLALPKPALQPFWDILADPAIEKICHAGDQDIEIAWLQGGLVPQNVFDTQIGAGMLGIAYPTALWRVVEYFSGTVLDKAHTYSAWNRRPLTKAQFAYAIDDVRYLPAIHREMVQRIESLGHLTWMTTACEDMCKEAADPVDAGKLFAKVRGAGSLNAIQLAVLRELAALREQLACDCDLPLRRILKDDPLLAIAARMPEKAAALAAIRDVPKQLVEAYGNEFVEAVIRGQAVPKEQRPSLRAPPEDSAAVKRLAETLWVAAQTICLGQSVTPALVTCQNEILSLARILHKKKPPLTSLEKHPIMLGWRRECLGEKLLQFLQQNLRIDLAMKENALCAEFTKRSDISSSEA
ncbi:MAG: HRDC domain-containing protein [Phycisphaerales bacterium]|nr:HRDC domain-containing protein [Phycisphaerales bacterium]